MRFGLASGLLGGVRGRGLLFDRLLLLLLFLGLGLNLLLRSLLLFGGLLVFLPDVSV